jgi:hypothetical protein
LATIILPSSLIAEPAVAVANATIIRDVVQNGHPWPDFSRSRVLNPRRGSGR